LTILHFIRHNVASRIVSDNCPNLDREALQHLKRVSRIKHVILQKYLPTWVLILGSSNRSLAYLDCFAGPGAYEFEGAPVDGSPVIAVKSAKEYLASHSGHQLDMYLVDDAITQLAMLERVLGTVEPFPGNLRVHLRLADSREYIPGLIASLPEESPIFVLVDPYGHPLPIPVINQILQRNRTEVLINLMWFRINMDLGNPVMGDHLDDLFGDREWREQPFMRMRGQERENAFLDYFKLHTSALYLLTFRIRYDVEDRTGTGRTKYYLIHASNNVKAALLMKEIMWPLGDEAGTFDYSGVAQGVLISQTPLESELREILLREFAGQDVSFNDIREETWHLPFIEKHYRSVLKSLEGSAVTITRTESKKTGLKGRDRIQFSGKPKK
jgi:three-Cys-motif partner protein